MEQLAKKMYEAYGKTTDFKNFMGDDMPKWCELPKTIKAAWINAAYAARLELCSQV